MVETSIYKVTFVYQQNKTVTVYGCDMIEVEHRMKQTIRDFDLPMFREWSIKSIERK